MPQLARLVINDQDEEGHEFVAYWFVRRYGAAAVDSVSKAANLIFRVQNSLPGAMDNWLAENAACLLYTSRCV